MRTTWFAIVDPVWRVDLLQVQFSNNARYETWSTLSLHARLAIYAAARRV